MGFVFCGKDYGCFVYSNAQPKISSPNIPGSLFILMYIIFV